LSSNGKRWTNKVPLIISGFFPLGTVKREGHALLKVATRVGILQLSRQICYHRGEDRHFLPSNRLLPAHGGMVITRHLQEWACLLSLDLPFDTAQRLLGWLTGEPRIVCSSELRHLVRTHGQILREAERAAVAAGRAAAVAGPVSLPWVPATPPRRPAAWPAAAQAAVAAALAQATPEPPAGVRRGDWERVLAVRQAEGEQPDLATLARLGPEIGPGEVVATVDEVLVRTPAQGKFAELRTARLATAAGFRYLCGVGDEWTQTLRHWLLLAAAAPLHLRLVGDGGPWIGPLWTQLQAEQPGGTLVLDWYHLVKKCRDRVSRMGGDRGARRSLLQQLLRVLWRGEVAPARALLEEFRERVRQPEPLDELQRYLERHEAAIPCYQQERQQRRYIGSGWVEKANDLLVARRQKRRGMHWNLETSEGLARLKLLLLNHEWDAYWQGGQAASLLPT
jgi:hypothetical protein